MSDHRRLQRTLFRMQIDAGFARRMFARDPEALATTGLEGEDLERLLAVDPRAVAADAGGRRVARLVGNVSLEFLRTVHLAGTRLERIGFAMEFARSPELHDALRHDRPLPLAFARHAARTLEDGGNDVTLAVLALETALARARRAPRPGAHAPRAGEVALAATAWLVELPSGTLDFAAELGAAAASGAALADGPASPLGPDAETVLVRTATAGDGPWPRDVEAEHLGEAAAAVVRRAETGLGRDARAALAREWAAEPAELEGFVESLEADGVLVRGR